MPKGEHLKGKPRTPGAGRAKGTHNKFTTLKDAFINAFIRIGGEDAIYQWLNPEQLQVTDGNGKVRIIDLSGDRKKEFFKIMSQMLPRDVNVSGGMNLYTQVWNGAITKSGSVDPDGRITKSKT